jgi:hypothetical protein
LRREIAERVKKTTFVPKTKKEEELPIKLLDDPKIPTARRNPRTPHHSHKPLDGVEAERPYCTRRRHYYLNTASLQTLTLKAENNCIPHRHHVGIKPFQDGQNQPFFS